MSHNSDEHADGGDFSVMTSQSGSRNKSSLAGVMCSCLGIYRSTFCTVHVSPLRKLAPVKTARSFDDTTAPQREELMIEDHQLHRESYYRSSPCGRKQLTRNLFQFAVDLTALAAPSSVSIFATDTNEPKLNGRAHRHQLTGSEILSLLSKSAHRPKGKSCVEQDHEKRARKRKGKRNSPSCGCFAASAEFISTSAFSYIRSVVDDAAPVRSETAVEQARMIRTVQ
jgi:hypothetical protein